jgi:hypothetical protein
MRQRALCRRTLILACVSAGLLSVVLLVPMAKSAPSSAPPAVVDAQMSGLPALGDAGVASQAGSAGWVRSEAVATPIAFSLVGFAVPEGVAVEFRARHGDGGWQEWHSAPVTPNEAPDPGSSEARRAADAEAGKRFSAPVWVGPADRLQVRVAGGSPERVDVHLIDALGQNRDVGQRLSDAAQAVASALTQGGRPAAASVERPEIVSRDGWGADEAHRSGSPDYAEDVEGAVIHHTATGNDYSRSEAPAVVRSIYHYHTQSRGWSDIGYNFLIDRFGTVYQGRAGGVTEPVIGAHAAGYNAGTTGVAFLGSHHRETGTALSDPAAASAERLLTWLFDVHHIDAETDATVNGESLPAVVGHSAVGSTSCPGGHVRDRLDGIRRDLVDGQAPMLTDPDQSDPPVNLGARVEVSAGMKPAGEWELTVRHESGDVVERASGQGQVASASWQADQRGAYQWEITSDQRRPATGEVRVLEALAERVDGDGPIAGAVELSQLAFSESDSAQRAVLARHDVFADAMAGGPLAGSQGPLLLTPSDELDDRVETELARVLPETATVYVLGGEAAIEDAVVDELDDRWDVQRVAGRERTETAAMIGHEVLDRSGGDQAMLARSAPDEANPWADALAGSVWGAANGVPVALTPTERLTRPTEELLARVDYTIVLGGTAAISRNVAEQTPSPWRVSGGDRASTATEIATHMWDATSASADDRFLVGAGWSDRGWQRALAAAPLGAKKEAPLLLTAADRLSGPTAAYLEDMEYQGGERTGGGWVLHGPSMIDEEAWTDVNALLQ